MSTEVVQQSRDWFPRAASLWCDMERGLYEHPDGRKPKPGKDGTYRVVKAQILRDCGITDSYHDPSTRIWKNPHFLKALEMERRRRDNGLATIAQELEKVVGPLHETRNKVIKHVKDIFEREPDAEDPTALSPAQYVKEGMNWIRYIDETEGRTEAVKAETIEGIMGKMAQTNLVNAEMMGSAMELLQQHRAEQDKRLRHIGVIEGELADE